MTARLRVATTTLSTSNAQALAGFYESLLGWRRDADEPGWVTLAGDDNSHRLAFHQDDEYRPPTWPSRPDAPPIMMHLEIATDDLDAAVEHALACGARLAAVQPQPHVRVMLDPDGHPFCLFPGDV